MVGYDAAKGKCGWCIGDIAMSPQDNAIPANSVGKSAKCCFILSPLKHIGFKRASLDLVAPIAFVWRDWNSILSRPILLTGTSPT